MATTESYVLKDGLLVPEEQLTAQITTRTNVSQIPKLDILFKPIVTDNIGNNVLPQANSDIDWNLNLNIINIGGFRGFGKRRALRDALNANKNTLIWNGNGFQRVNTGLGADRWSRRDVRRLMRSYNDNWSTIDNTAPEEGNNTNYAAYLSLNYLDNNPTATSFRWIAGKYPLKAVEELQNIQNVLNNIELDSVQQPDFYSGLRNYLLESTTQKNKEILGSNYKTRDVVLNTPKDKSNNIIKKQEAPLVNQLELPISQSLEYIPTRLDYLSAYASIVSNPTYENAADRFLLRPFNYNERRYPSDLNPENFLTFDEMRVLARRNNQDYKVYAQLNGYIWDGNGGVYRKLFKKGGTMIYQQGGTIGLQESDQDEKLMQAALFGFIGLNPDTDTLTAIATIAEAYMQDPNSLSLIIQDLDSIKKGINIMQKREPLILQLIVKPGALKTIVNKFLRQRVKQAKMGTKLDYIKQLKNICPEGYEIEFRKAGGSVCPVCKKKHKALKAEQGEKIEKDCGGGISKTMNSIKKAMKCGGNVKKAENGLEAKKPLKKQLIHPADTLHSGKEIYDLSGKIKKYPYLTPERYQKLPQKDKVNADLKDEERGRKKGDER